ncbi:MAG: polynucleotide adenylyltransferase PcnB, partial [Gammaproteobacteria bacterium]|nr:polynucleotide adenylyltransferase PcnB [Gammaproteobacteria bacterium]
MSDAKAYLLHPHMVGRNALEVIETLQNAGFLAYVVGGGVRDLLLGHKPKDFDVATNAKPEEVRALFRNSRLIGRRFRLAHVYFRHDIVEVSTFRAGHDQAENEDAAQTEDGVITRDNVFGSLEEDAVRRDLTINALYYDPIAHQILDHCDALHDLKAQRIRLIGDPDVRFQEDPIRVLRAIRFSNKLNFSLERGTKSAMKKHVRRLDLIPAGRRFDEYTKLFLYGNAVKNFKSLHDFQALPYLFPSLSAHLKEAQFTPMLEAALKNTDERVMEGKTVNPAFLISIFLWPAMLEEATRFQTMGLHENAALIDAMSRVLNRQIQYTAMPKRFSLSIKEIWMMQRHLERRRPKYIGKVFHSPRFRAAYDFLLLRAEGEKALKPLCQWWEEFQFADAATQSNMIDALTVQTSTPTTDYGHIWQA